MSQMSGNEQKKKMQELKNIYKQMSLEKKRDFLNNMKIQLDADRTEGKVKLYNELCQMYKDEKDEGEDKLIGETSTHKKQEKQKSYNNNNARKEESQKVNGNKPKKEQQPINRAKEFIKEIYKNLKEDEQENYRIIMKLIHNNKKKLIVFCTVLAVMLLYSTFGMGGVPTSPEKTCEVFIEACMKGDFKRASKLFPYETPADSGVYEIYEVFKELKGERYTIKRVEGTGLFNHSDGEVYYRISFEEYEEYLELTLIREGNAYYVLSTQIINDMTKLWDFFQGL